MKLKLDIDPDIVAMMAAEVAVVESSAPEEPENEKAFGVVSCALVVTVKGTGGADPTVTDAVAPVENAAGDVARTRNEPPAVRLADVP